MKVLVCGDRHWSDQERINYVLNLTHQTYPIELVIEGEASGADTMARIWAESNNIPVAKHPANWAKYGRAAGPIRNADMLKEQPDVVIAFHNDINSSKGTLNMLRQARKKNIKTCLVTSEKISYEKT